MPFSQESISIYLKVLEATKDVALGAIGGLIAYLVDYITAQKKKDKGEEIVFVFRFTSLFINMALGAFVAYIVGGLLDEDFGRYRDALIGLSGVSAYQILILSEHKFATFIVNKFSKKD